MGFAQLAMGFASCDSLEMGLVQPVTEVVSLFYKQEYRIPTMAYSAVLYIIVSLSNVMNYTQ